MNVLMFVMTMLMLLALMTYSRLDAFRSSQVFQSIFKYYMEVDERGYFNLKADPMYEGIKVNTKEGKGGGGPKAEGSPRLGIALLVDQKQRESKPKEWTQTKLLLKNLIETLYKDQPFYKEAIEKRPSLPDELINAITHAADALPKDKKITNASDLANLKLADPELDQILYKILQGATYKDINGKRTTENDEEVVEPEVDQSQADESLANEGTEYKSVKGYFSLLDYVTTNSTPKIRVYLAPRAVLQSIFIKPEIVQSIIDERKQLYRQVIKGADPKELTTTFKDRYDRDKEPGVAEESLNFTVTKTNPKTYE